MKPRRNTTRADAALIAAMVVPFVALGVQAFANQWHGRTLIPQQVGLRGVRSVWTEPILANAVTGSLVVATVVAAIAVVLAWPAAKYLADSRPPAGWALLAAPVLLPPLVLGDGLAPWLLEFGITGRPAVVIAHLPIAIAYAALALVPAFGPELDELDQSAAMLGANAAQRLIHIVIPAARAHVILGFALGFTVSWSQYATSLTVGGGTPMLPLVLVPYVRSDPQIAAVLAMVFVTPPIVALATASRIGGHRSCGSHV